MQIIPSKNPPPLERSRKQGKILTDPRFRPASPERWQPNNWIVKADQVSKKKYSAWWLIWIAISWIGLVGFLIYVFV